MLGLTAVLAGLTLGPRTGVRANRSISVRVAGLDVDLEQDSGESALELARRYLSSPIELTAGDERLSVPRSVIGAGVDLGHLVTLLEQARDPRSALRRVPEQVGVEDGIDLPMPVTVDERKAIPLLVRLKDAIDRGPRAARYDSRTGRIKRASKGVYLDVHATLDALGPALRNGTKHVNARLFRYPDDGTADGIEKVDVSRLISEFQTRYDRSLNARERTQYLKNAAAAVDGTILQPGRFFDFTRVTGGRLGATDRRNRKARGEERAGVSPAEGICQAASTLHAAAYLAGLPIEKRRPHDHPTRYIKLGLDARLDDGKDNLRFKNDLPFPLVVGMTADNGIVRTEIRGAKQTRTVLFERIIDSYTPFDRSTVEDPTLPGGTRILQRRGVPGFRVIRVRSVTNRGTDEKKTWRSIERYQPVTEIWRIGTGVRADGRATLPPNDTRAEYVADEYLTMKLGPGIDGVEVRKKPGETGVYGWTSREEFAAKR
jgi:vancomycin resistance protein YoaR